MGASLCRNSQAVSSEEVIYKSVPAGGPRDNKQSDFFEPGLGLKVGYLEDAGQNRKEYRPSNLQETAPKDAPAKKAEEDPLQYGEISIAYASQSGTAAKFANILAQEAEKEGFAPKVWDVTDYKANALANNVAIFCAATYGEGDPPDNAKEFFEYLKDKENPSDLMKGLKFTVFGLGNTQYEHYNATGKSLDKFLEKLGGERVYNYGEGDDNSSLEDDFNAWKENIWKGLKAVIPPLKQRRKSSGGAQGAEKAGLSVKNLGAGARIWNADSAKGKEYDFQTKHFLDAVDANIIEAKEVRQNNRDGSTLHFVVDLEGTGIEYRTAQNLAVFVRNSDDEVAELGKYFGLANLDEVIDLKYTAPEGSTRPFKFPFPTPITIREAFSYFCDINGQLMKRTLKELAEITDKEKVRKRLEFLVSNDGKKQFHEEIELAKKGVFDIMKEFGITMPLEKFFTLTSRIGPRLYTISSSNLMYPKRVHFTVSLLTDVLPDKSQRMGLASKYFRDLYQRYLKGESRLSLRIQFRSSTFVLPEDKACPIIMIGPGTGIAPFRAFLQEHDYLRKASNNANARPLSLYFGCRHAEGDFIFKPEIEDYLNRGVLSKLYTAFSRDKDRKEYVQDLMNEKEFCEVLFEKNGKVYICGSTSMGKDVVAKLASFVGRYHNLEESAAVEFVKKLEKDGKLIKELW